MWDYRVLAWAPAPFSSFVHAGLSLNDYRAKRAHDLMSTEHLRKEGEAGGELRTTLHLSRVEFCNRQKSIGFPIKHFPASLALVSGFDAPVIAEHTAVLRPFLIYWFTCYEC